MRPGWYHNRRPKCQDQGGIRGRASRPNERGRGPSSHSCRRSIPRGRVSAMGTPIADTDSPRHRRADRFPATPPRLFDCLQQELSGVIRPRLRRPQERLPLTRGRWRRAVPQILALWPTLSAPYRRSIRCRIRSLWSKRDTDVIELLTRPGTSTLQGAPKIPNRTMSIKRGRSHAGGFYWASRLTTPVKTDGIAAAAGTMRARMGAKPLA